MLMDKLMTSDEDAMSLGGLEEVKRRHLIQEAQMVDHLKREIHNMQGQLQRAQIRIMELVHEKEELKKKLK
jgi:hypothetical protein